MRTGSASFLHKGAQHQFRYGYLAGSNLLQSLAMPNGENFTPECDADGNQTLIQTSTGLWKVQYNG